jgi:SAM-dependent methyltransferase
VTEQDAVRAAYDAMPYESWPITRSHPDNLAATAMLFGIDAPHPDRSRVLELGSASGGNLLPLAYEYPHSEFLGVDLSPVQVEQGRRAISALGLTNVRLETGDIAELELDAASYDYIICHGVFSWVPPAVSDAILRVCAHALSPNGIAYISYNTYPGWHPRMLLRTMSLSQDDRSLPPAERVKRARAFIDHIVARAEGKTSAYAASLRELQELMQVQYDSLVFHEYLEPFNRPMLFSEFVAAAAAHGLRYVAEAQPSQSWTEEHRQERSLAEFVRDEQEADFVVGGAFRRSLLCRSSLAPRTSPRPDVLEQLWVERRFVEIDPDPEHLARAPRVRAFRAGDDRQVVTTDDPIVFGMLDALTSGPKRVAELHAALEAAVPQECGRFTAQLFVAVTASLVALRYLPSPMASHLKEFPTASVLARFQAAARSRQASTLQHDALHIVPIEQFLLPYMDGSRDRAALADEMERALRDGIISVAPALDRAQIEDVLDQMLTRFLLNGVLQS